MNPFPCGLALPYPRGVATTESGRPGERVPLVAVADDDRVTREYVAGLLKGHGYSVETLSNGQQAIDRVNQGGVDLVLLDIIMPGLSGLDCCRLIKTMTQESFLPVVLVTAKTDTDSRVEGLRIGADDYVCKPFDERELLARVQGMLRIKRLHDDVQTAKDRLDKLAVQDELTGLYNYRYLHTRLAEEFKRAERYRDPLACAMVDIDNFKSFNDEHGHDVGDKRPRRGGAAAAHGRARDRRRRALRWRRVSPGPSEHALLRRAHGRRPRVARRERRPGPPRRGRASGHDLGRRGALPEPRRPEQGPAAQGLRQGPLSSQGGRSKSHLRVPAPRLHLQTRASVRRMTRTIVSFSMALTLALSACGSEPHVVREPPPPIAIPDNAQLADPVALGDEATRGSLPPAAGFVLGPFEDGPTFADAQPGVAWWMSREGKLVAFYRFSQPPTIAADGVTSRRPTLEVFDRRTGDIENYDELVAADPLGRMAVFRESSHLWLLDESSRQRVDLASRDSADVTADANACMAPRQASFEPLGRFFAYLRTGPDRIVVRDLETRDELEVEAPRGRIWRAVPSSLEEWVLMRIVPGDDADEPEFPVRTGCDCTYCERLARTPRTPGEPRGAEVSSWLIGPDGRIPLEGNADAIPLGPRAVGYPETREIRRPEGGAYPLPEGCSDPAFVRGVPVALLVCAEHSMLLYPSELLEQPAAEEPAPRRRHGRRAPPPPPPAEPKTIALTDYVIPLPVSLPMKDSEGHRWIAVLVDRHLARLRLEDGRLEVGPPATSIADRHSSGWVLAMTPTGVAALHVGDGRVRTLDGDGLSSPADLAVRTRTGSIVLEPERGRAFRTEHPAHLFTSQACTLQPDRSAENGLETGPWRLRCPAGPTN